MSTFAQTTDRDLALPNGQLKIVRDVAEEAAIVLQNKFLLVKGEWFLDTRVGAPYMTYVYVKNPDLLVIRQVFRKIILSTQGIKEIINLSLDFNRGARRLSFSFRALADNGRIVSGGSGQPFIVEPS